MINVFVFLLFSALFLAGIIISFNLLIGDRELPITYFVVPYLLAIILILVFYTVFMNILGLPFLPGMDLMKFDQVARYMVERGTLLAPSSINPRIDAPGIYVLNAIIYQVFGHNTLIIRAFYAFLFALILIYVYKLAKEIFGLEVARNSLLLVALFPNFYVYIILPHKEIMVAFLLLLCNWNLLQLVRRTGLVRLCFTVIFGYLLFLVRPELFILWLLTTGVFLTWRKVGTNIPQKVTAMLLIAILLLGVGQVAKYSGSFGRSFKFLNPGYVIQEAKKYQSAVTRRVEGGGVGNWIVQASLPVRSVLGSVMFLVRPFPITSTLQSLSLEAFMTPGTMVLYFLFPYAVSGTFVLRGWEKEVAFWGLFLFSQVLLLVFAVGIIWGGLTARWRVQVMPYFLIFTALGLGYSRNYKRIQTVYWFLFGFGVFLYLMAKITI